MRQWSVSEAMALRGQRPVLSAVVAALAVATALSAQPERDGRYWTQEWTGEAASAKRIEVRASGRVVVRGTDRDDVRYTLTTRGRSERGGKWVPVVFNESGVVFERRSDHTLAMNLRDPVCGSCRVEFLLDVEIPKATAEVDLLTRAGGIVVQGIDGSVTARAVGGSILVDEVQGAVTATTAGGSVQLGTIGGPVNCETAGGSIVLARSGGQARLVTSAGTIRATSVAGDLRAETGGGSIEIGRVEGTVRAKTGGGFIRAADVRNGMRAEAGAGDIRIAKARGTLVLLSGAGDIVAALQEGASLNDSEITTSVGAIVLSLPESLALTLEASIDLARGMRGIVSEFPSIQVQRSSRSFGPVSEQAVGEINGGGSVVRIRNGLGRIEIKKSRQAVAVR